MWGGAATGGGAAIEPPRLRGGGRGWPARRRAGRRCRNGAAPSPGRRAPGCTAGQPRWGCRNGAAPSPGRRGPGSRAPTPAPRCRNGAAPSPGRRARRRSRRDRPGRCCRNGAAPSPGRRVHHLVPPGQHGDVAAMEPPRLRGGGTQRPARQKRTSEPPQWSRPVSGAEGRTARRSPRARWRRRNGAAPSPGRRVRRPDVQGRVEDAAMEPPRLRGGGWHGPQERSASLPGRNGAAPSPGRRAQVPLRPARKGPSGRNGAAPSPGRTVHVLRGGDDGRRRAAMEPPRLRGGGPTSRCPRRGRLCGRNGAAPSPGRWSRPVSGAECQNPTPS